MSNNPKFQTPVSLNHFKWPQICPFHKHIVFQYVEDPVVGRPMSLTCGMVFIRLYRCTSSSLVGMRCCPFPIPAGRGKQRQQTRRSQSDLTSCHSSCEEPSSGGYKLNLQRNYRPQCQPPSEGYCPKFQFGISLRIATIKVIQKAPHYDKCYKKVPFYTSRSDDLANNNLYILVLSGGGQIMQLFKKKNGATVVVYLQFYTNNKKFHTL